MKKITILFIYIAAFGLICVNCTKIDEYKKFIPEGEKIYPQKADSLKAYPGKNRIMLEWQIIDPKVDHCKVFWYQDSELNSVDVPVITDFEYTNKTTNVVIDELGENNYIFTIISYDKTGNSSIPVEIEETSYGEIYELSLLNRLIRKKEFLPGTGLIIEWHETDETMLDVELSYTNLANEVKTIVVSKESTSSLLSDFNVEHPFSYTTLYKPDSLAIDIFHAAPQEEQVSYYANISLILQNTGDPFQLGEMVHDNRFYKLPGWQTNAAGGRNGNLDVLKNSPNHGLTLWAWSGYSPLSSFENGKLYQTVELEEGTYRFDALIYATSPSLNRAYVVAALGNELPDIDKLSTALSTTVVPNDIKDSSLNKPILSIEFTLREKTNVTLGFVADIGHAQETIFKKVELFEKR